MADVGDGDEVLDIVLWRLGYRPDSAWSKKRLALTKDPKLMSSKCDRNVIKKKEVKPGV